MKTKDILVIGSSNTDMVVKAKRIPSPGMTVMGGLFFMNPGGKGANQAVAASRLGGRVSFLGKIGNDIFGEQALEALKNDGINTDPVCIDDQNPSGVALITVDENGENSIVVSPGANSTLSKRDIDLGIQKLDDFGIILLQLEIPLETVLYVVELAVKTNKRVVFNPAPATKIPNTLWKGIHTVTPNETEAEILTGVRICNFDDAYQAAKRLKGYGVKVVIITMGKAGAFVLSDGFRGNITSPDVTAIDTTAAGDTFNGALAVAFSEGKSLQEAVGFACKAASVSVTRTGAQSSIPYRHEI